MDMSTVIGLSLSALLVYFFSRKKEDVQVSKKFKEDVKKLTREELKAMASRRNAEWTPEKEEKKSASFKVDDIKKGYKPFEDTTFFVHGVKARFKDCLEWAKGEGHLINFKREKNNKYDSNAIAIYGTSSSGKFKLGYVAAEIADDLVYKELDDKIKARLISVKIEETPFIEYEILVESKAYSESDN